MDANANKPVRQKKVSKLQKRDKEKRVATVDANNHPMLAVLRSMRGPTQDITSGTLHCTSPRHTQAASRDDMALLPQNAGSDNALLLTPRILLPIPPVIDVDILNCEDIDIDSNNELPNVLSDATSTGRGKLIPGKGASVVDVVEGEYAPLPDDYPFDYSPTSNKLRGGVDVHDDDDLDSLIDVSVTDEVASKNNFFDRLAHYMDGHRITNRNCKAVELTIFAEAGTYIRGLDPMERA
jgi:hypothetical protein